MIEEPTVISFLDLALTGLVMPYMYKVKHLFPYSMGKKQEQLKGRQRNCLEHFVT
jgi:hypothetical protein